MGRDDVIALRYRELACAVLNNAADDYIAARCAGYAGYGQLRAIDDMWFEVTGINREYFTKELIKKGDRKYGKQISKRSKV